MNIRFAAAFVAASTLAALASTATAQSQSRAGMQAAAAQAQAQAIRPCTNVTVDPPTTLTLGKSRVIRLDFPAARIIVGGQSSSRAGRPQPAASAAAGAPPDAGNGVQGAGGVADTEITLLGPTELFFLGRKTGSMNVVLQAADGRCVVKDIVVTVDPGTLQAKLAELLPEETGIQVRGADSGLVLTGYVSDVVKLEQALALAGSYADGKKIVNMLRLAAPQQVMLEVKIAEVSKTLLDRFGLDFSRLVTSANGLTSTIVSGIVGGATGAVGRFQSDFPFHAIGGAGSATVSGGSAAANAALGSTDTSITQNPDGSFSRKITFGPQTVGKSASLTSLDMQKKDGILRVLAEPNIMAISGQSASFLSGGKIFIPVAQSREGLAGTTITLEEKEFGVGLKFTPTVLDGSRVNLKLVTEVSELQQSGTPFLTVGGATAILPSMATRRVDTTVQLQDGQTFAVAGLIKNNVNEALTKFPGLGEVPVMGALFRSTEFQTDQTELMFLVTPRLVKPITGPVTLPTDNHVVPTRADVILMGSGEGKDPPPAVQPASAPAPAASPATTR
jgi:pilus assembly protein CpaC